MMLTGVTGVLKNRSGKAFKSTCSYKRAEPPDLSRGFPVTDEKSFMLGWFNEGQPYIFRFKVRTRGRIF